MPQNLVFPKCNFRNLQIYTYLQCFYKLYLNAASCQTADSTRSAHHKKKAQKKGTKNIKQIFAYSNVVQFLRILMIMTELYRSFNSNYIDVRIVSCLAVSSI